MFYFILSIIVISNLVATAYLYTQVSKKNVGIYKEIAESNAILPMPPRNPKFEDVDSDFQTLKDVIKSISLEEWVCEVIDDARLECYDVNFTNPVKTLHLRVRLRINDIYPEKIHLSWLNLTITLPDGKKDAVSFDTDNNIVKYKAISLAWNHVLKYHEDKNSATRKDFMDLKKAINDQLKTLARDSKLNSMF